MLAKLNSGVGGLTGHGDNGDEGMHEDDGEMGRRGVLVRGDDDKEDGDGLNSLLNLLNPICNQC